MKDVINFKEWFLQKHNTFEDSLNGENTYQMHQIRKEALENFNELPLPTLKDEDWRYTNISPLLKYNFNIVTKDAKISNDTIQNYRFNNLKSHLIVFMNGQFSAENSKLLNLPNGVVIGSLSDAIKNNPEIVEKYFNKNATNNHQIFAALSTAYTKDGAFIYVPEGKIVEEPIHIIFITSSKDEKIITQPRNLFIAEKNSQLTIIEHYISDEENIYFTNAVTEIVVNESAVVDHVKLQEESKNAFHIARMEVGQERNSNFTSHSISLGGALTRNNINALFNDEGSECTLNGLFLIEGEQLFDVHTLIDHAKPLCNSHEYYIGILDNKARGVFNGKVLVRPDAQKTNAFQKNKNIILSDQALINTKPELEIFADDVKCSHGATIGQMDEEAKFYLRSRGIADKTATAILIRAFSSDVIKSIKIKQIRNYLDELLSKRFSQ